MGWQQIQNLILWIFFFSTSSTPTALHMFLAKLYQPNQKMHCFPCSPPQLCCTKFWHRMLTMMKRMMMMMTMELMYSSWWLHYLLLRRLQSQIRGSLAGPTANRWWRWNNEGNMAWNLPWATNNHNSNNKCHCNNAEMIITPIKPPRQTFKTIGIKMKHRKKLKQDQQIDKQNNQLSSASQSHSSMHPSIYF